jgi:hypothetical protein
MPFAGLLVLLSIAAPSGHAQAHAAPQAAAHDARLATVWQGGPVPRCPEDLRLDAHPRKLVEVPETWPRLADKTGGAPGWVPPRRDWPVPCVSPAGR